MRPLDVTAEQQRRHDELVRAMSPVARARALDDLCGAVRQLARAGIRQRHPGATEPLQRWLFVEQVYGQSAAVRLLGERPAA